MNASTRRAKELLLRWRLGYQKHMMDGDLTVPLALSIFLVQSKKGEPTSSAVMDVLRKWQRRRSVKS